MDKERFLAVLRAVVDELDREGKISDDVLAELVEFGVIDLK